MSAATDPLVGRTLDGRYRIESVAARGGMATVYIASDLRLRRVVAVKVMHASLAEDPNFVARFEREARSAAAMTHPAIVAVHDQGADDASGAVYLVMELVQGYTLRDVLADRGPLSPVQALAVMDPVLQALAAAHQAGFVHRDVKPENVMISDDGRIKVTDFGLARAMEDGEQTATTRSVLIGTVAYLSPEQVELGMADARSDVYSAGILLFELLTGQVPHAGETPVAIAFSHVHKDVPLPSSIKPGLPTALDSLVARATQRNPGRRFQTADEFLEGVRAMREALESGTVPPQSAEPIQPEVTPVVDNRATTVLNLPSAPDTATRITEIPAEPAEVDDAVDDDFADDYFDDRPPRRRRGRRLRRLVLMLLLLAGASFAYQQFFANRTTVPQLVGTTKTQALTALKESGLTADDITLVFSDRVDKNIVMDAEPVSGTKVKRGSTVHLTVSQGPQLFAIPSVSGQSVTDATTAITKAHLRVSGTSTAYSDTVAVGMVIETDPAIGTKHAKNTDVTIITSLGPKPIAVPAVNGKSLASAQAKLAAAGFTAVEVTHAFHNTVSKGNVIKVTPAAGTKLVPSTTVTLLISDGPPPVTVPDVVGRTRAQAFKTLTAAGLVPAVDSSNACKKGYRIVNTAVLQQSAAAKSTVAKGTTVGLGIYNYCSKK